MIGSDHLEALSKDGDPLDVLQQTVDFEYFRAWLVEGLGYGDGTTGRIHYTKWTDQNGTERYGCEIIAEQVDFLAKAKEAAKDEPK